MTGLDIIGDVHGCANKLRGLLKRLGYREQGGAFRHPGREAIFVGDLIDRGPEQVDTVNLVRSMVDAEAAQVVMGNHEFNAISFATRDPENSGSFMRRHSAKNVDQHKAFLDQVKGAQYLEFIEWFKTLPLWLDLEGVRIVHACWHDPSIHTIADDVDANSMSESFVVKANTKSTSQFEAIETVLKGPEVDLGNARAFMVKGHCRSGARIRWWLSDAKTLQQLAEIPAAATTPAGEPYPPLGDEPRPEAVTYRYESETPVVFGHYWRSGSLRVDGPSTTCVDYSAVEGGPLVAYRWDGDPTLKDSNLVEFGGTKI
jgi:calcineurin-like phosphoesterase family protein